MRRFTRLTNGHSKKAVHHVAAVSFHFFVYMIQPHETLTKRQGSNCTPAMAAGYVKTPLTFDDMIDLIR